MKKKFSLFLVLTMLILGINLMTLVNAEGTATIWTDKTDYSPEETVTIFGSGFLANAEVTVTVTRPDGNVNPPAWTVTSDESSNFETAYLLDGILGTYTVVATDGTNTATTTFTDAAINKLTPDNGPHGTVVTVEGNGFSEGSHRVYFDVDGDSNWDSGEPYQDVTIPAKGNQFSTTLTVPPVAAGDYYIRADVSPYESPDEATKKFTVTANQPPVLASIGDKTVNELATLAFTATATDPNSPPQILTFSLTGTIPTGASITSGGDFSWTPSETQGPGSYPITVVVSDGVATDSETITVTVDEVNRAPTVTAIDDVAHHNEMTELSFTATATDPDVPANTWTFSLVGETYGASIASGGLFSWTPTEEQGPGGYSFTVRATDNGSPALSDDEAFSVHVDEVNRAPVLDTIGDLTVPWGETLSFTATATDDDIPANTLTFSLVGAPTGASITSGGAFSWTTTSSQIGPHTFTVKVKDNGVPSLSDEEEITVTVTKRSTTLIYSGDLSGQYSDEVTVKATLKDTLSGAKLSSKTITFTIGSQSASDDTDGSGYAEAKITLDQPSGDYDIESEFVEDSLYLGSVDSDPFKINKETATITYTGDSYVLTTGLLVDTAPVRLSAKIVPNDVGGDLTKMKVEFTLTPDVGSAIKVHDVLVNALGEALIIKDIKVGVYEIEVAIEPSDYWSCGIDSGALTVDYGSGTKKVTGGGWIPDPLSINGKGNFGFVVNYNNKKSPQGSFIYVFRGTDGYNYIVKSNSWSGGGLWFTGENKAYFTGRCNVKMINRATGESTGLGGNWQFTVDITDGDLTTPRTVDKFAITVVQTNGVIWRQIGTPSAQIPLGGGNVVIHNK